MKSVSNALKQKNHADPQRTPSQLADWIESILDTYELPAVHAARLERILENILRFPERIVALDVGRLMFILERNGLITDKTALADDAIQHLIESGRTGDIEGEKGELLQWFRKHYFWATTTTTIEVAAAQGEDADQLIQRYFQSSMN